jgi:hypothetical protein
MRLPKVYLETTLFNFYIDRDREAHSATVNLFQAIAGGKYEAFTSRYVVDELGKASEPKRGIMLNLILEYDIPILEPDDEAARLAELYVVDGVIPQRFKTDGLHIAIAAVNDLDMIISMNFQHIVKRKTIKMTGHINEMNGYRAIEIYSPMEVIEYENDDESIHRTGNQ